MSEKSGGFKLKTEYVIIAAILAAGFALFFLSSDKTANTSELTETEKYVNALEDKLEKTLSGVNGLSKVSVAITVSEGISSVVAVDEKSVDEDGKKTSTSSVVIVGGKPLILGEAYPEITGVLVVGKGADDIIVKTSVLNAVTTALNVPCNKVQILAR